MFWQELERAAEREGKPLNALIAEVDALRLEARPAPNLTSALRQWLFARVTEE
jgi:predicted DNA-binding ribbon-helix-helix protein